MERVDHRAVDRRRRRRAQPARSIAFVLMVAVADRRAVLRLSAVPDAGAVLCAVRLRLQSADRLCRPAVVRPRAVFRLGELSRGACRQGLGLPARARDPDRHATAAVPRRGRRRARDPPPGHLLRDDHAGAGADDVLLRPAGEVHRRRGRHPGGAARQAVRPDRSRQQTTMYIVVLGDLPRAASC